MTGPEQRPQPAPGREAEPPPAPDAAATDSPAFPFPTSPADTPEVAPLPGEMPESTPTAGDSPETEAPAGLATDSLTEAEGGGAEPKRLPIYRDFNLLQLAAIVFLVDQLTKFLVRAYLPFGHSYPFDGFFRFTHTHNTGSAFGILQGQNTPLIFVSFVGIIVLALIYRSQPRPTNLLRLSLGLQIGGALGNLLDRFRLGAVTDFIDVGAWPVFNLADASIVTGLCLLGWLLLRPGAREDSPAPAADGVASAETGGEVAADAAGEAAAETMSPVPMPETGDGELAEPPPPPDAPDCPAPPAAENPAGRDGAL